MTSNDGSNGLLEFPSAVWPLHCRGGNGKLAGLVPFGQGTAERLLPLIGGDGQTTWQPASKYHKPGEEFILQSHDPVLLRPRTRMPGLLKRLQRQPTAASSYSEAVSYLSDTHREIDIPSDLLKELIYEDHGDSEWERAGVTDGNTMAVCRPELDRDAPISDDAARKLGSKWRVRERFQQNVKRVDTAEPWGEETQYAWSSKHEWALYAGGECGNQLFGMPLPEINDSDQTIFSTVRPRQSAGSKDVDVVPALELTTPIKQIVTRREHPGYACVRTMSTAALLRVTQKPSQFTGVPLLEADVAGNPYSFGTGDQWTSHMSWSPWDMSQAALASSTGSMRIWNFELNSDTLIEEELDQPCQWNTCEYWNSPRHILRANPDELYFLDTRTNCKRVSVLDLRESRFAFENELFTAAVPSAMHPMHAAAASTHVIRIFDQRYLKQPIMAWKHNCLGDDPPVFLDTAVLPNSTYSRATVVMAASRESLDVSSYVYGQDSAAGPFISIEQHMLKDAAPVSNSFRTAVQEVLATDPFVDSVTNEGVVRTDQPVTMPMAGMVLHTFPDHCHDHVLSGVCVTVDESSAVVGRRVSFLADTDSQISQTTYDKTIEKCWHDAKLCDDGSIIDGLGFILDTKETRDRKSEWYIDLMRSHGIPFRRFNVIEKYKSLVGVDVQAKGRKHMRYGKLFKTRLPPAVDRKETSLFNLVRIAASPGATNYVPADKLPSWTADGVALRDALLRMDPAVVEDVWKRNGISGLRELASNSERNKASSSSIKPHRDTSEDPRHIAEAESSLRSIFNVQDASALAEALEHAAEDVALADVRISTDPGQAASGDTLDPVNLLEAKVTQLTKPAQLLKKLWRFDPMTDGDGSQTHQSQPALSYHSSSQAAKRQKRSMRTAATDTQDTQPLTGSQLPLTPASPLFSATRASQLQGTPAIARATPTTQGPPKVVFSRHVANLGVQPAGRTQGSETQLTVPDFFSQVPAPSQATTQPAVVTAQSQRVPGTVKKKKKKRRSGF